MRIRNAAFLCLAAPLLLVNQNARAQTEPSPNDSIRVSVIGNEDGSTTAYQVDVANHKGSAITTAPGGKVLSKIEYVLDDAGRYASGKSYSADGKLLFSTAYKYDTAGRLREEDRFGKDKRPAEKIVYDYDAAGKLTGYSVLDPNGKVLGRTSVPAPTPKKRR
jgi:hypothetical protein